MGAHRALVSRPDFKSGVAGHKPAGCVRFARAPARFFGHLDLQNKISQKA